MNTIIPTRRTWLPIGAALVLAVVVLGSYPTIVAAGEVKVTLTGEQEAPPVKSAGTGTGTFTVGDDGVVKGSVTIKGIDGTAAHIYEGAVGKNGPVVILLDKDGDTYTVPANAKLTDTQLESFKAGNLYVNVHTAAHPDGELRGQLKP